MIALWELFFSYFKIGIFTFGGGYAALPLIQEEIVQNRGWITIQEFSDLLTISQMTPGPIAINAATFVGAKVAGFPGAVVATLGSITPALIIVLTLAYLYYKYKNLTAVQSVLNSLHPSIVAFIASAGVTLVLAATFPEDLTGRVDMFAVVVMVIGVYILRKYKIDPIKYMLFSGILGVLYYGVFV